MKKFLLILLSLGLISLATISNAKSIRIGTEGAYPPWNNLNSAGELEGAEIDFGNEACARMGVDCEWVTQDWDGIIPALLQGKYDIIIAGMSITEERKQKVNFTTGYMNDGARFWTLKDSALADMAIAGVTKVNMNNAGGKELAAVGQLIAAFEGKTICVQSSTTHANFASQYLSGSSVVKLYQTVDDHNLDLIAGRCDAILSDVASAIDFMETDQGSVAAFSGPTFSGGPWGDGVGGAIRKEDTDILDMWNKVIAEMAADGTTAEITKKWFGRDMSM
ncbi:MAG: Nopaline-binding periplasmic protein [Alphaproteobacteria bacterium MarineAlpha5_Bin5]|nr:MAG: Nopaline-binding periplasmic protein [Alphaproteobacteria bacterium MarineAlpha5_Bin4]PPR50168.1 MAG: Nopaline-binding periplasmic protein [Alphaproteobacteria bacterium MarineAlpha5_Bin5]